MKYLILFLALVPAWAQRETYGNVGNAYTKFDMSAALSSRPVPEKASDPATCTEGMRYYNTTSHKGRLCTGTNTWADEAGSGSAATLSTPRAIYGNNFDGSAALAQIIASTYGGTGNGFTKFSGPATAEKTFTLPNASATILTSNAAVTVAQGGTGATTLTGPLKGNGTSAFSAAAYTDLVALWASGSCSGFLKNDGTCAAAGSGTVTVVSSGSLTSTAIVTGGGTTTLQTPSATATLDSSGNISTPGGISTGVGGSTAGVLELGQGAAPSAGTTSVKLYAPASVTSYIMNVPGAAATGYLYGTNSAGVVTQSFRSIQAGDVPTLNQNTTGTAAGLTANGSNCSAGSFPLGVDAAGAVESCTAVTSINVTAAQMPALTGDVTTSAGAVATTIAANAVTPAKSSTAMKRDVIGIAVGDPAGSALATGVLGYVVVPNACTIAGWDIVVDGGTATVDVWKVGTGTAKPTVSNTITASAKPAISTGTVIHSTTLTGWTTSVTAFDIIGFNLDTVATAKYITVQLFCDRQ